MSISEYPSYELKPRKLSREETANPYLVIQDLFDYGHLPELRELLWHWFKTTVMGCYHKGLNRNERFDVINMYEHIEKLIEAVHLIHQNRGGWAKSAMGPGEIEIEPAAKSAEYNLISLLTLTLQPESIFKYSPPGNNGTVCILLVLPKQVQTPQKNAEALLEIAGSVNTQYCFWVMQFAELEQKLNDGHIFYTTVCTYANRVYHNDAPPLPMLPPKRIEEIKAAATAQVDQACSRAAAFLQGAVNYMQSGEQAVAAFMLHQAAELLLRVVILILTGREIKTHALPVLLKHTACFEPCINSVFAPVQAIIPLLDKAYTEARYGSITVTEDQGKDMEQLVSRLLKVTKEQLEITIRNFGSHTQTEQTAK
jgi:HEPN domain-containing protein